MPDLDFSQPLVGAGASAANDFSSVEANTGLDFLGIAQLKRGIRTELGLEAFANADATFSKYITASITGTAAARAKAGLVLQLKLNLFEELGLSVKASAIADVNAGVRGKLGINIGDFVALAKRNQEVIGLPLELLFLFLEEVEIGAEFFASVAAAAKAHATISISGTVIKQNNRKPGFFFLMEAGAGLGAGADYGVEAGCGFINFRRFYGRAVDKTINYACNEIINRLPSKVNSDAVHIIEALKPVSKIVFRLAYEVGFTIKQAQPQANENGMKILCKNAVNVILEELQRFVFENILQVALKSIMDAIENELNALTDNALQKTKNEREQLAALLKSIPDEPFQVNNDNIKFWADVVNLVIVVLDKLNPNAVKNKQTQEALSLIYCTTTLLIEAVRSKLINASAHAIAIGAGSVVANNKPYSGNLDSQPPSFIKTNIQTKLGITTDLQYENLLEYFLDDLILDNLINSTPALKILLTDWKADFNMLEGDLLKAFLTNIGSFLPDKNGKVSPVDTLRPFVMVIDKFITNKVTEIALKEVNKHILDPTLKIYFAEVILSTAVFTKDITLQQILNWDKKKISNEQFNEALSSILTMLIGRTLVVVADAFFTYSQESVKKELQNISDAIKENNNSMTVIRPFLKDEILKKLVVDSLSVAGEVLGPLPIATRERIRHLLYQSLTPLIPGEEHSFMDQMLDELFVPNLDDMSALQEELFEIAKKRLALFAEKTILQGAKFIEDKIEELLASIQAIIDAWHDALVDSILGLGQQLLQLQAIITTQRLLVKNELENVANDFRDFIEKFSGSSIKGSMKKAIANLVFENSFAQLINNGLYKAAPRSARVALENNLTSGIYALIDSKFTGNVFTVFDQFEHELTDWIPDVSTLNENENLEEQVLNLVLDKIEEKLTDKIRLPDLEFAITIEVPYIKINLGITILKKRTVLNKIRSAIHDLDIYHSKLNRLAISLGNYFGKQAILIAKQTQQGTLISQQKTKQQQKAEYDRDDQHFEIISPVPLKNYVADIEFKIKLKNSGLTVLGRNKGEQQRFFVFINGALIPVNSFELAPLDVKTEPVILTGRANKVLPQTSTLHTIVASNALIGEVMRSTDINNNKVLKYVTDNTGQPSAPVITDEEITIIFKATKTGIVKGSNVLTVVLIDGDKNRHQQNISFSYLPNTLPTNTAIRKNQLDEKTVTTVIRDMLSNPGKKMEVKELNIINVKVKNKNLKLKPALNVDVTTLNNNIKAAKKIIKNNR